MKAIKFISGWVLITFLLLGSVVIQDLFFLLFKGAEVNDARATDLYSINDMLFGILSESLRALLLCYLFPQIKNAGSSYIHAIKFGLTISALIGTMWLIIGYGSFTLKDPGAFVLYDASILTIQGIASGIGLCFLFKKEFI